MTRERKFLKDIDVKAFEVHLLVRSILAVMVLTLCVGVIVLSMSRSRSVGSDSDVLLKLDSRSYAEKIEAADIALTRGNWRIATVTFEEAVLASKEAKVSDVVVADLCLRAASCLSEYGLTLEDNESASLSADRRELARSAQHFFSCALALYDSAGDKRGQLLVHELRLQSIAFPLLSSQEQEQDRMHQQNNRLKKASLTTEEDVVTASR